MLFKNRLNSYQQLGGGRFDLTGEARAAYLWRCNEVICKKLTQEEFEKGISDNLSILYEVIKRVIESEKISCSLKTKCLDYLERIKSEVIQYSIKNMNLKSLQCVILITLLIIEKNNHSDEVLMKTYPPQYQIMDIFEHLFLNDNWLNLQKLEEICITDFTLRRLIKKYSRPTFQQIAKNQIPESIEYEKNMENLHICVLLGELSLEEILDSEFNLVHLIGITTEMEWADGRYYTPFEFLHHDLVHASNIEYALINDAIKEYSLFYKYLKQKKLTLGEKYDDYIIMLFLIFHESFNTSGILENKTIPTMEDVDAGSSGFIKDVKSWMNPRFFSGLLPPKIKDIENEDEKREKIIPYLNETLEELYKEYQEFIKSQSGGNYYKKYLKYKKKYLLLSNSI